MPYRILKVSERGMLEAYERTLADHGFTADAVQQVAAERLQHLYDQLLAFKVRRQSAMRRLFSPPELPRGIYFWGGVGRGKSFLMDCFYGSVPMSVNAVCISMHSCGMFITG